MLHRPLLAALLAVTVALAIAPSANAGTMTHWSCHNAAGDTTLPTDGWDRYIRRPESGTRWLSGIYIDDTLLNQCVEIDELSGALFGLRAAILPANENARSGWAAAWGYSVPDGMTLSGFTAIRNRTAACGYQYDHGAVPMVWNDTNQTIDRGDSVDRRCGSNKVKYDEHFALFQPTSLTAIRRLYFGAECQGNEHGSCATTRPYTSSNTTTIPSALYEVGSFQAQLNDSVAPSVTDVSGLLATATTHTGVESVTYSATDGQSGLYRTIAQVKLFGQGDWKTLSTEIVDANGGRCKDAGFIDHSAYEFLYQRPCKLDVEGAVARVDTGQMPAGQHTLRIQVEDATGNPTDVIPPSAFTVEGPKPSTVVSQPGPGSDPAPTTGGTSLTATNGANASFGALLRLRYQARTVKYGEKPQLSGTLVNEAGAPIQNATVFVDQRSYVPKTGNVGPAFTALGKVTTNSTGAFVVQIPAGASRSLRFSYKAHPDQDGFAASALSQVIVKAKVTVKAKRTKLRNGQTFTLTGKVAGDVPKAGLVVTLQAYVRGRGWTPAQTTKKTVRTRANGQFTASYKFTETRKTTRYSFRVVVQRDSAFAFGQGVSRTVKITVRPGR